MREIHDGQCGLCTHFGEQHPQEQQLISIRIKGEGPADYVDECHHPRHESLRLKVTPISGCDGFEPAQAA